MQEIDFSVQKTNLYELIAEKLEDMILSDSSQLGQKLPSEQSLATSFGVSRNVIRESLKLLKERQLITMRTGEGSYIAKPQTQDLANLLNRMMLMDNIHYSNVLEMRSLLEPYACQCAARMGTPAGFNELVEINDIMSQKRDDIDERIKYELLFHRKIAELSGNPLLACFVQSMASLLTPLIRKALLPSEGHINGVVFHYRIVEVLRTGDPDKAEQIMRDHLEASADNLLLAEQSMREE